MVTCVAAAAPSLVPSNKLELVLLIVVGYLVVVAPGAGPLSAGRQWYLRRDRSKPYDAAAEFSPYPDSKSADAALDGTANNAEDAGSVNGSTAPLTGCHAGDGVSTTKAIDCCDSQRSISSTTSTDATLWKGSTSAAPLPLTAIVFDEPYGRHGEGKTSLSLGNYHILRHHKLSGGSVWQLTEILKQGAKGWYELTDGSIEIIVHKDDRGRLVDSLHKTFPASAIDSTYNPLAANADKPVHVARYEYICKMDEIKKRLGPSSLLAAIYEHWLQEWSKEQDKH